MTEFVRVRLDNGAHKSIPAHRAEALKLPTLKSPALRRDGSPATTKHRVTKGAAVATTTPNEATDASESKED